MTRHLSRERAATALRAAVVGSPLKKTPTNCKSSPKNDCDAGEDFVAELEEQARLRRRDAQPADRLAQRVLHGC